LTDITAMETRQGLSLRLKLLFSIGSLITSMPQALIVFFQRYFLTDIPVL